jgi:hypothetical protein
MNYSGLSRLERLAHEKRHDVFRLFQLEKPTEIWIVNQTQLI